MIGSTDDTKGDDGKPQPATFSRAYQAPHRERLRCALACAHAARRVYEHRHQHDDRLRPSLALISEVAAAGSHARRTATASRLKSALQALQAASKGADTLTGLVLATTMDAFEAALAVLNRKPWRLVDEHARRAYMRADHAVSTAYVEAAQRGPDAIAALGKALAGQDLRAFEYARSLWLPALESDQSTDDPHAERARSALTLAVGGGGNQQPMELAARAEELTQAIVQAPAPAEEGTPAGRVAPAPASPGIDPAALAILASTPAVLAALLERLPADLLGVPWGESWSIAQVVAHLHDTEGVAFTERITRMLEEDRPVIRSIDPSLRLAGSRYAERGPAELLEDLARARAEHVAWLGGLSAADLARPGEHDEAGEITTRDIVHQWAYHDLAHLAQIVMLVQQRLARNMGNTRRFYGLQDV